MLVTESNCQGRHQTGRAVGQPWLAYDQYNSVHRFSFHHLSQLSYSYKLVSRCCLCVSLRVKPGAQIITAANRQLYSCMHRPTN